MCCCCCGLLCESLRIFSCARCCYEDQMDHCESHDKAELNNKWIRRYEKEEHRGFLILQRERRLKEQEHGGDDILPRSENTSQSMPMPPVYGQLSKIQRENKGVENVLPQNKIPNPSQSVPPVYGKGSQAVLAEDLAGLHEQY